VAFPVFGGAGRKAFFHLLEKQTMATQAEQKALIDLYTGIFGLLPTAESLAWYESVIDNQQPDFIQLANILLDDDSKQGASNTFSPNLTSEQFVKKVYSQLFAFTDQQLAEQQHVDGVAYWTDILDNTANGDKGELVAHMYYAVVNNATTIDPATQNARNVLVNRYEISKYYAIDLGADTQDLNFRRQVIGVIDGTSKSVVTAKDIIDQSTSIQGSTYKLTAGLDDLVGTSGNDLFKANIGQLGDTDEINGGTGTDTLEVVLRDGSALYPTLSSVERVVVTAQANRQDWNGDNNIGDEANLDAGRAKGVDYWEDTQSRADLVIEDVRIRDSAITRDVTIAFTESDPGHVDFALYFDQPSLRAKGHSNSDLVVSLYDKAGAATNTGDLATNPYNILSFKVDGVLYDLDIGLVNNNTVTTPPATYNDLLKAIQVAIAAHPVLSTFGIGADLSGPVEVWAGNTLLETIPASITLHTTDRVLEKGGWVANAGANPNGQVSYYQENAAVANTDLVTSTIILDHVGRGSTGGDLVIGGLSTGDTSNSRGVQQFDITVKQDSKLEIISSTNDTLQVVNIKNGGKFEHLGSPYRDDTEREGNLVVQGNTEIQTLVNSLSGTKYIPDNQDTKGPGNSKTINSGTNQHINGLDKEESNGYGFTDVKTIYAATYTGKLSLNAVLTQDVTGKYLDLKDKAPALAAADNVGFAYTLGSNADVFDLAIDSANLAAAGTATREDFYLNIDGGSGNDTISTAIYESGNGNNGTSRLAYGGTNTAPNHWYANQVLNSVLDNVNLVIKSGAGDDTVNTFGSGDWTIELGAGNDTYYADNTAAKASWVFNTADQINTGAQVERNIYNLLSDRNDTYIAGVANGYDSTDLGSLYGLKLRVVFQDVADGTTDGIFISKVVEVPAIGKYAVTDLQINQAIKDAINTDPVLGKLLVAKDGPANTLVVTALSDGVHVRDDLRVEFAIPTLTELENHFKGTAIDAWKAAVGATGTWTGAQIAQTIVNAYETLVETGSTSPLNSLWPHPATTGYGAWKFDQNNSASTGYYSEFANAGPAGAQITGLNSGHISDNLINSNTGDDVIVLSTGHDSNDTIVYTGTGNGFDTIVNFADDEDTVSHTPTAVAASFTVALSDSNITTNGSSYSLDFGLGGTVLSSTETNSGARTADQVGGLFVGSATLFGVNWTVANTSGVLTFTQNTGVGTAPAITTEVVQGYGNTGTITAPSITALITNPGGTTGVPGWDHLDFTSYGVDGVFLDNSEKYTEPHSNSVSATPELAAVAIAAGSPATFTIAGALPTTTTHTATYIVLKQLYADDTIYEITWWKDQAHGQPDSGTADIYDQHIDTLLGTIGTVDFGKQLDIDWFAAAGSVLF
jgi:hypothetical protein